MFQAFSAFSLPSLPWSIDPDVDKIIKSGATVVLADDNVSDGTISRLEEADIKVVQFHYGNTKADVNTTYTSVGSILNGKEGKEKAESALWRVLPARNLQITLLPWLASFLC